MGDQTMRFVQLIENYQCLYNNTLQEYFRQDPAPSGSSAKAKKPYYLHDVMKFVLPYVRPVQHSENTGNISQVDLNTNLPQSNEYDSLFNDNDLEKNIEQNVNETTERQPKCTQERLRNENSDVDNAILQYVNEKRKNKAIKDDRKMFLLSLLPDIENLSERNLRQFKIKTFLLLEQMSR
ncbi:hypothetical protein ABEB36_013690 [Hypothenemus hampei]|uniref:BESS domain-containing protein n=1 Tax=Hypothenemus hampei TaxID=57062 RepID=A0ABD1E5C5_HYPHA